MTVLFEGGSHLLERAVYLGGDPRLPTLDREVGPDEQSLIGRTAARTAQAEVDAGLPGFYLPCG